MADEFQEFSNDMYAFSTPWSCRIIGYELWKVLWLITELLKWNIIVFCYTTKYWMDFFQNDTVISQGMKKGDDFKVFL